MFILLPTHDASASIAEITLALLERHWPDHPEAHVLHHSKAPNFHRPPRVHLHDRGSDDSRWLGNVVCFLETRAEELFLLLLDDYALCGSPRRERIALAQRLMIEDRAVGLFPLCWYPAAGRMPREDRPGFVTLRGAPVLLQAALWRRAAFLDLARGMDGRTSPWGFEALATRKFKSLGMEICSANMPIPNFVGGHLVDGFDKTNWPLPYHNLMHRGKPERMHEEFLQREGLGFPSRGLGDTVARIAGATGIAQVVNRISRASGGDCGCQRRRQRLNRAFPYRDGD